MRHLILRTSIPLALSLTLSACTAGTLLPPDHRLPDGSTHSGEIRDGLFHGEGVQRFPDGMVYKGNFREGYWHGEGRWKDANGGVYQGTFKQGQLTGTGEYTGPNGEHYEGKFRNFRFHGEGVLTRADGARVEASFRFGQPVGEGSLYRPGDDGELREIPGRWQNGEFIPEGEKSPRKKRQVVNERILARDAQRLRKQLDKLAPSRPHKPDLYFLGVGGDGAASVFRRDLRVVHSTLDAAFDVRNRSVRLLNDREYRQFPLATRTSIREALNRLDEVMHSEQDLLFVHLTSHGGRNGEIKLQQPGLDLPNLAPSQFSQWLGNLDIHYKAVVVSAFFSGHWVEALEGPNALIMSASRSDRPAMGCGEQSEMTWFTRALYEQPETFSLADPKTLFQQAKRQIRQWEKEKNVPEDQTTHPQLHLGDATRTYLQRSF